MLVYITTICYLSFVLNFILITNIFLYNTHKFRNILDTILSEYKNKYEVQNILSNNLVCRE